MKTFYFDTSALVKLYVEETGSAWVAAVFNNPYNQISISKIGVTEAASALARRCRMGELDAEHQQQLYAKMLRDSRERFHTVGVSETIIYAAAELTQRHPLRGYDAIHLATALELNRVLTANRLPAVTFVSADDKLNAAAGSEGLAVEKPGESR